MIKVEDLIDIDKESQALEASESLIRITAAPSI